MKIALIFSFFFLSIGILFSQEKQLELFPQNVDISDYTNCICNDTINIKQIIKNKDIYENEKLSYDDSKFTFADINDDGVCEILHYFSSGVRGWPYDYLTIYMFLDTLNKIGEFSSFLLNFAESDGEFLQINYGKISGHKTNPIYYNSVWRFNGKEYAPSYSPNLNKGEFKSKGLNAYKNKMYEDAYIYFKNVLAIPHHSPAQLLESANDVAITLIKLNRYDEVQPLLEKYIKDATNENVIASAYYNIGLAMEKLGNKKSAYLNFKKSCDLNETNACKTKLLELKNKQQSTE